MAKLPKYVIFLNHILHTQILHEKQRFIREITENIIPFQVYHVNCNFMLGQRCLVTVIFGALKDENLFIITLHQTIVLATETSFKMPLTLCQNKMTYFWQKAVDFIVFGLFNNVQIFPSLSYTLITELKMEFQTFNVSICNGNKKYPIGTLTFYTDFCAQALSCFNC